MQIDSDFLLIGSGIGGLTFALQVADHGSVAIVTKKSDEESNTNYAQGGIAAVVSEKDSFQSHIEDTLQAGAGLCKRKVVEQVVRRGPECIRQLQIWGTQFSTRAKQPRALSLGREGGHSHDRIVHAADLTGAEVERALLERVKSHPNIRLFPNHIAIDLILSPRASARETSDSISRCQGAYVLDTETGDVHVFGAQVTLLATGGCGRVYTHTTNPEIATGDGLAMAYRAGAVAANLEFMQFHPTTLYGPKARSFLISEAVRGFGAILRTRSGERFMEKHHPAKELAPRDIVARAIDRELKLSGDPYVLLDLTHLDPDAVKSRFPYIHKRCQDLHIDITREPLWVVPAAHYMCGGVRTDWTGKTSILGLYATGEVACTGLHGANRLASNSLLEALVFSKNAAESSLEEIKKAPTSRIEIPPWSKGGSPSHEEWVLISHDRHEIQRLMWDYVGIMRSNDRLKRADKRIRLIGLEIEEFYRRSVAAEGIIELRNIALLAQLIIRSALRRKESRGLHFNTDYPERDDRRWRRDTLLRCSRQI
jgi:L-aspartate oxidase